MEIEPVHWEWARGPGAQPVSAREMMRRATKTPHMAAVLVREWVAPGGEAASAADSVVSESATGRGGGCAAVRARQPPDRRSLRKPGH